MNIKFSEGVSGAILGISHDSIILDYLVMNDRNILQRTLERQNRNCYRLNLMNEVQIIIQYSTQFGPKDQ